MKKISIIILISVLSMLLVMSCKKSNTSISIISDSTSVVDTIKCDTLKISSIDSTKK